MPVDTLPGSEHGTSIGEMNRLVGVYFSGIPENLHSKILFYRGGKRGRGNRAITFHLICQLACSPTG
jgi:hypothetical protein